MKKVEKTCEWSIDDSIEEDPEWHTSCEAIYPYGYDYKFCPICGKVIKWKSE